MRAVVPTSVTDNRPDAFPEGFYEGTISGAAVRDPNKDGSWVLVALSLSDITPREGTADPGRKSYRSDILLRNTDRDGNVVDIRELDSVNGGTPFQIRRAAGLLAGLGLAVGAAERTPQGDIVDFGAVAEQLVGGAFEGQRISFQVNHWTPKGGGEARDQIVRIGPAA